MFGDGLIVFGDGMFVVGDVLFVVGDCCCCWRRMLVFKMYCLWLDIYCLCAVGDGLFVFGDGLQLSYLRNNYYINKSISV